METDIFMLKFNTVIYYLLQQNQIGLCGDRYTIYRINWGQ
jgi:hypothetical protein